MKVGIACSAGGSAPLAARAVFDTVYPGRLSYVVLTDRACGMEDACAREDIPCTRIEERKRADLSRGMAAHFQEAGVDFALLFFLRLVTKDLYGALPTLNIHPALLPSFKGMDAVGQAIAANVRFLGCSLHMVDETVDGGPLVAQACHPLPPGTALKTAESLSFCQKTLLALVLFEMAADGNISFKCENGVFHATLAPGLAAGPHATPGLTSPLLKAAYNDYLDTLGYGAWKLP